MINLLRTFGMKILSFLVGLSLTDVINFAEGASKGIGAIEALKASYRVIRIALGDREYEQILTELYNIDSTVDELKVSHPGIETLVMHIVDELNDYFHLPENIEKDKNDGIVNVSTLKTIDKFITKHGVKDLPVDALGKKALKYISETIVQDRLAVPE